MAAASKTPKRGLTKAQTLARAQAKVHTAQRELADAELKLRGSAGRPTAYRPEYGSRAVGLCMLGYTNEELAQSFGVDVKTLDAWIADVPEFSACLYAGRDGADAEVVSAMFHAARGYSHEEDDIRTVSLGNNEGSQIEITRTKKFYPPNVSAAQLILANRQRRRWSATALAAANGSGNADQTPESLAMAAQAAIRAALRDDAPPLPTEGNAA